MKSIDVVQRRNGGPKLRWGVIAPAARSLQVVMHQIWRQGVKSIDVVQRRNVGPKQRLATPREGVEQNEQMVTETWSWKRGEKRIDAERKKNGRPRQVQDDLLGPELNRVLLKMLGGNETRVVMLLTVRDLEPKPVVNRTASVNETRAGE